MQTLLNNSFEVRCGVLREVDHSPGDVESIAKRKKTMTTAMERMPIRLINEPFGVRTSMDFSFVMWQAGIEKTEKFRHFNPTSRAYRLDNGKIGFQFESFPRSLTSR